MGGRTKTFFLVQEYEKEYAPACRNAHKPYEDTKNIPLSAAI